jgi:hypothetical protein
MIIAVSTLIFAAASVVAVSDRWALAKTAAIATHAFGFAPPSSVPPTSEGASVATAWAESGGRGCDVVASQRMYAAEITIRTALRAGTARSVAVIPVATATRTIVVPTMIPARYAKERSTP